MNEYGRGLTVLVAMAITSTSLQVAAKDPGNVPDAYGNLLTEFYSTYGYPSFIPPVPPSAAPFQCRA